MPATTKNTKSKSNRGGARKGAGRKATGKKYFTYYLDPKLGTAVSKQRNPSKFVEDAIREKLTPGKVVHEVGNVSDDSLNSLKPKTK